VKFLGSLRSDSLRRTTCCELAFGKLINKDARFFMQRSSYVQLLVRKFLNSRSELHVGAFVRTESSCTSIFRRL
jgi:hypothetical protein